MKISREIIKCNLANFTSKVLGYSPVIVWKKLVNLPLIATEGFSTVLDSAMYPY